MSAVSGIVAGFVVIGGAVALYRFAQRKGGELREALDGIRRPEGHDGGVLDFERDPSTGVYRTKD
jgi:hypothetical protein